MADQTFEVASGSSRNRRAAHPGGRQHVVKAVQPGKACGRRRGEEPAGKRKQTDAGQQSNDRQHDPERQHPFVAFIQCKIRKQGAHQISS